MFLRHTASSVHLLLLSAMGLFPQRVIHTQHAYQHQAQCIMCSLGAVGRPPLLIHMDHIWDTLVGIYPSFPLEQYPIIVSVFYYALNIITGITLRRVVKSHVSARWQPYLLNTITAFQGLACSLENTQIRHYYGKTAYWLTLTTLSMISVLTVKGSSSNPCSQMLQYVKGTFGIKELLLRIASQTVGALLSYQYARQFWSLGLHPGHIAKHHKTSCISDLTVSPTAGFVIEFSLTIFDVLCGLFVFTRYHLCETAVKLAISCYFVTVGLHLTGMYANPLNASNQTFGCDGMTILEHLLIYWVAPLAATVFGYKLYRLLARSTTVSKKRQQEGQDLASANGRSKVKNGVSRNKSKEKQELVRSHKDNIRKRKNASRAKRA